MGMIAQSLVAYAQPLIDESDGSMEAVQYAMTLSQLCWNLAIMPESERDEQLAKSRPLFDMNDSQFEEFRQSVFVPMIRRHHEMFPGMGRHGQTGLSRSPSTSQTLPAPAPRIEKYPGTGRNRPFPCNSGKKYKLCCGR